jgi:diguanylate cyclase (GGDEF)-like protein
MARVGRVADVAQRFGLVAMVGLLLIAYWAIVAVLFSVQHKRLMADADRDLRLVNNAVAQHAAAMFRNVETDLRTIDLWLRTHPGIDPLKDPAFIALVAEMSRASRALIELRLVDRDGRLHTLPSAPGQAPIYVGDRDYVDAHASRAGERRLFVGAPVANRIDGHWVLPMSWQLHANDGRYVIASASVRLDALFRIHDRLRYQPDGTISLVRNDGVVLSRTPFDPRLMGRDVRQLQNFDRDVTTANGSFTSKGLLTDRVPRMGTFERLDEVPVVVVVSRSVADVTEAFELRRRVILGTSLLLSAGIVAFTAFLHRSQRALRRAQDDLQRLATTDELTGAANRRAFSAMAEREFLRARRFNRPFTLLALDIDHFKVVNDHHGHAVGDRVLQSCCVRWNRLLREQDVLGRLGGEEFAVLLPETPRAEALAVADRLRASVASGHIVDGVRVTVSIGLADLGPADVVWADTLERADQALYAAKHAGRNRVEVTDGPAAS